ncbi:hypothetical protein CK203_102663 [Vitis vinifera]|uniref:Uncharacterized protein n=1 Tax=Vitis vinifera TaxID=29760 RepID=A0A438C5Z0_VITVI|nr:hypothetical protein CK203_102663 [Vitis vinifera]
MELLRIAMRAPCHQGRGPYTLHMQTTPFRCVALHIPPGCLTSGILLRRHSIRIFRIRRLTPDRRGGRFNFPGQTYPDPLIALTRRVSQPFCIVLRQPNSEDFSSEDERLGSSSLGMKKASCACHIEYEIAEEAMNFMSYVAEVSRGWDESNARDMGRMTS